MSNDHHIGKKSENVNAGIQSPRNPLLSTSSIFHPCGYADTLNNCASTLYMLADFFGENTEHHGYDLLGTDARRGMWNILYGVADVIRTASKITPSYEAFEEINVSFSAGEHELISKLARHRDCSVETLVNLLVKQQLGIAS